MLFSRLARLYGESYNHGGRMFNEPGSYYGGSGHWQNVKRWTDTAIGIISATDLKDGSSIIEFGCGPGVLVDIFVGSGFDAYGFDIGIDGIKSKRCAVGNILHPPVRRRFDVIVALDVIEHVPFDMHAEMFARLLEISDLMVCTVPCTPPFHRHDSSEVRHHYVSMDDSSWRDHFESNGWYVHAGTAELKCIGPPFSYGIDNTPFLLRSQKPVNLAISEGKHYYRGMETIVKVFCPHPVKTVSGRLGVEIVPGVNEFPREIAMELLSAGIVVPVDDVVVSPAVAEGITDELVPGVKPVKEKKRG